MNKLFHSLLHQIRPLYLLFSALSYLLGVGLARYLTGSISQSAFWLGMIWMLVFQSAAFLLAEYFRLGFEPLSMDDPPHQIERLRTLLLQISAALLILVAFLAVLMFYTKILVLSAGFVLALIFITLIAYGIPPLRLVNRGYGEYTLAVMWSFFIPAISFMLQTGDFHRLLSLIAFPLMLLALAYLLLSDFPVFATDQKFGRINLLIRLTWTRAVPIHHLLILAGYLLFTIAPLFGCPWNLLWPVFLTLPFAGLQIVSLQLIAQGGRSLWKMITSLAAAVFGLTLYLLVLAFWLN